MDCQMPEMDGFEATRLMPRRDPKTPVIALTAGVLAADRDRCLRAGMDDYLAKPVSLSDFSSIIEKWCPMKPKPTQ